MEQKVKVAGIWFVLGTFFILGGGIIATGQTPVTPVSESSLAVAKQSIVPVFRPERAEPASANTSSRKRATGSWTGFYIGGYGGGAFGSSHVTTSTVYSTSGFFDQTSIAPVAAAGDQTMNPRGFNGGGTAGYNFQAGSFVFGGETDIGVLHVSRTVNSSGQYVCCTPGFFIDQTVSTSWLYTARGRGGAVVGNTFIYGTAGLAMTKINYDGAFHEDTTPCPGGGGGGGDALPTVTTAGCVNNYAAESISFAKTQTGWTAGAGFEWMSGKWSLKGEYLYARFNTISATSTNLETHCCGNGHFFWPTSVFTHTANLNLNMARAGVNYHF